MVEEQRTEPQQFALTNLDDGTIVFYLRAKVVSDKVKAALAEVDQAEAGDARSWPPAGGSSEQQIRSIGEEQGRIRENMGRLDHGTDLYKRYVKKFSDQEDEIEKLRGQIKELREQETQLRNNLAEYLIGLNIE